MRALFVKKQPHPFGEKSPGFSIGGNELVDDFDDTQVGMLIHSMYFLT